jgi:hypothetical protein
VIGHGLVEILARHLFEGAEENRKNKYVKISGAPMETRTEHLPNASLERYLCSNFLGEKDLFSIQIYSKSHYFPNRPTSGSPRISS